MNDQEQIPLREELDYIRHLTIDLKDVLKQQREMLKVSGFRLPPGTTTTLSDIANRLDASAGRLTMIEHERDQYRVLADTAALINSSLELGQVLNEVMDRIIALAKAERGYLMLRNENTGELEFTIARNVEQEDLDSSAFEISQSIVRRVSEQGEAVLTTNAQEDDRFQHSQSIVSYSLRSILCVPLIVNEEVIGVIYTDNKIRAGLFTEFTRDLLKAFANQAGIAIQNARLYERIKQSLDEITELKSLQDNIFASIASGVITINDKEQVTLLNRSAQEILDLEHTDTVGSGLYDLLPDMGERFEALVHQARVDNVEMTSVEFDASMAEGETINLSMSISPLKDAYSATLGVAIVLDDLTEVKRREAQIAGVRRYLPSVVVDGIRSAEELKLGGTRQTISIMFADIRGFSTFSENLDPVTLVEVINTYWTISSDAIHLHNGIIDKFMGDAVMALYNTALRPQEDHALRAVRTAATLLSDIRAFHQTVPEEDRIYFGIGVHSGEAVVGNVGSPERLDYTAMGDSVNLSKRLQEEAAPMQILISDDTYQAVRDYVEVRELEPIQVKGRKQYTKIYELLKAN